jgi:hypothetical protein
MCAGEAISLRWVDTTRNVSVIVDKFGYMGVCICWIMLIFVKIIYRYG